MVAFFEWSPEQKSGVQHIQAVVQEALLLGPCGLCVIGGIFGDKSYHVDFMAGYSRRITM